MHLVCLDVSFKMKQKKPHIQVYYDRHSKQHLIADPKLQLKQPNTNHYISSILGFIIFTF